MVIKYYQTIPELGIKGRMNTPEEFDKIGLPKDLTNQSVIDIGSNAGAFCLEAVKRGATRVHGVEVNMDWRIVANGIVDELELKNHDYYPISYVESLADAPKCDLVLLLSVTHVTPDGQKLLDEAWAKTKRMMILEVNTRLQPQSLNIPNAFNLHGKNKDNRSVYIGLKDN